MMASQKNRMVHSHQHKRLEVFSLFPPSSSLYLFLFVCFLVSLSLSFFFPLSSLELHHSNFYFLSPAPLLNTDRHPLLLLLLPPSSTQHPAPAHHPQHQQPCIMLLCSCTLSTHSPHPMLVVELSLTLSLRTSCCRHGHQPTTCLSPPCPNLASGLRESGLRHLSPTLQGSS